MPLHAGVAAIIPTPLHRYFSFPAAESIFFFLSTLVTSEVSMLFSDIASRVPRWTAWGRRGGGRREGKRREREERETGEKDTDRLRAMSARSSLFARSLARRTSVGKRVMVTTVGRVRARALRRVDPAVYIRARRERARDRVAPKRRTSSRSIPEVLR